MSNVLWRSAAPLLLASKSAARRALIAAAGIAFEAVGADIDEPALAAPLRKARVPAGAIAAHLARAKALTVSAANPHRLVVGADQVLALGEEIFSKPRDLSQAKAQLARLSGRSHTLHSALAVARGEEILFETAESATLTCRKLSDDFIGRYVEAVGDSVLASVGAYQIEGLGIHLFERIEGDYATIVGLPLLPLLAFLRREGSLVG
jgi:septum formation protein